MANERRKRTATRRSDESTHGVTTAKPPVVTPERPRSTKRQFQIVIVNRMSTPVTASVFAEDGTTPVSVKLMPSERSQPFNTERITPHTKRLRDRGHVRLETIS